MSIAKTKATGPQMMHRAMLSLLLGSSLIYAAIGSEDTSLRVGFVIASIPLIILGIRFLIQGRKLLLQQMANKNK